MGTTRYVIKIKEIGQETTLTRREWVQCGGGPDDSWGYGPSIENINDFEREIYAQTVTQLDLVKVINAVNTIEK